VGLTVKLTASEQSPPVDLSFLGWNRIHTSEMTTSKFKSVTGYATSRKVIYF
jgi:hypothetical protein